MIIPLGFLNEMEVDEKSGNVYHDKMFNYTCIGRIPAEIRGDKEKTIEYMIGKRWIRRRSGSPTATV